jgi:hypothetical protein
MPGPADPLPWQCNPERIETWIAIADAKQAPLGYEKDTAEFSVHAANYHARLADIVRRLAEWHVHKDDTIDILPIVADAAELWEEMQKEGGEE